MRKPRIQPSFASLTLADREQLADWLRTGTYEAVLERVNKPRSDGGFGLDISDKPIRTFHAKVALLDAINSKLPADKKIDLAIFETLAQRQIYYLTSATGEKSFAAAHQFILNASCGLAGVGDNTPTQLATLQRLIDFPARAEIRANKEERAQEMHDHRIEMDHFRKNIATQRLALAEKSLNLRVAADARRLTSTPRADINETNATSADPQSLNGDISTPNPQLSTDESEIPFLGPCPLPPEVVAENRRYAEKLRTGKIILDFSGDGVREILVDDNPTASEHNPNSGGTNPARSANLSTVLASGSPTSLRWCEAAAELSRDAINGPNAAKADQKTPSSPLPAGDEGQGEGFRAHPADQKTQNNHDPKDSSRPSPRSAVSANSASNSPPASTPTHDSSPITHDLKERVDRYTVARVREYIAHNQRYTPWPHRHSPPAYVTELRHCPCSNQCPCPIHESGDFRPFPSYFWNVTPFSLEYEIALRDRNLPYRRPTEYLP